MAINYLHTKMIVYRDIKPENIMLDIEGHIKLVDFGLAKILKDSRDRANSFVGSYEYLAPEVITKTGHNRMVDIYAIGILAYELLVGFPPFLENGKMSVRDQIMYKPINFPNFLSEYAKDFIKQCLHKDPAKR